jgi:hypothetical protein
VVSHISKEYLLSRQYGLIREVEEDIGNYGERHLRFMEAIQAAGSRGRGSTEIVLVYMDL